MTDIRKAVRAAIPNREGFDEDDLQMDNVLTACLTALDDGHPVITHPLARAGYR